MTGRRDIIGYLGVAGALGLMPDRGIQAGEDPSSSNGPTASIPFTLHGRTGRIAVTYGVIEDPIAAGFDVIPKLGFDTALCRGYPTIHAAIERYRGSGYRTLCGWIQVVTGKRYRTIDDDAGPADISTDIDKLPAMADLDLLLPGLASFPSFSTRRVGIWAVMSAFIGRPTPF